LSGAAASHQQFAPLEHDGALQFLSWTTTNALAATVGSF
jgi:hypothetical protein